MKRTNKYWAVLVMAIFLLLVSILGRAAENPFLHDWSTNSPGVKIKFSWDNGSEFNQWGQPAFHGDGSELWAAFYPGGFESGPLWKDLEAGTATNRFKVAEVEGGTTNAWVSFPAGAEYWVAAYAFANHAASTNYTTNYDSTGTPFVITNVNPATRIRSLPSNVVDVRVPAQLGNLHLLSTETLPGQLTLEETIEIDTTGSAAKFFTLRLQALPPLPPMPPGQ